jgi:hypothetical protein
MRSSTASDLSWRTCTPDEAFFSIDEYGPLAVKTKPGRMLAAPGCQPTVPQWQKSRGCIIITAALELAGNQVTHFCSGTKNTAMIRMMQVLIHEYADRRKLYLSWDAASWHISKQLYLRIDAHNLKAAKEGDAPLIETAPLPAGAQFLNVIESVFSGMARAIIHSSDYQSVEDARAAIDRYFAERKKHFRQHPRRAGKKIWGKEREPAVFSESNNCKDQNIDDLKYHIHVSWHEPAAPWVRRWVRFLKWTCRARGEPVGLFLTQLGRSMLFQKRKREHEPRLLGFTARPCSGLLPHNPASKDNIAGPVGSSVSGEEGGHEQERDSVDDAVGRSGL